MAADGNARALHVPKAPPWYRQYPTLLGAAWRSVLAYRANLFLFAVGGIAVQGTQLLFIGALLNQFGAIAGWTPAEIAFLYGMRLAAHVIGMVFFGQHYQTDMLLYQGEYDRFLLRPASPLLQLLTYRGNVGLVGDFVLAAVTLTTAVLLAQIEWSPALVIFAVAAIVGGGLVEGGLQIGLSGLTFRVRSSYSLKVTVDNTLREFGSYPMEIFGRQGAFALTFGLPLAFVAYLPAAVILGKTSELFVPIGLAVAAPAVGPLVLAVGISYFQRQSRFYTSPGA